MTVKDLINELLNFDMDAEVDVKVISPEETDSFDFEFEERRYGPLSLQVELDSYVLVNTQDFNDLQNENNELKDEKEALLEKIEELEDQ